MSIPFFADSDEQAFSQWNSVTLGPVVIPGLCVVTASKGRDVDLQKSKGKDGHSLKDNGAAPGEVTIDVTLTNVEQWERWQKIRPTIDPNRPGGVRNPLQIRHPECADRGIAAVYVKKITGLPPTAKSGKRFKIDCAEFVASPKKAKTNTKTLPAKKLRQNSFISDVAGETEQGQDFVRKMTENNF